MMEMETKVDEDRRSVEWRVAMTKPFQPVHTPWGAMWRGKTTSAGQEVWIEANERFMLLMIYNGISYFEAVPPGRHRFLLTTLDSTDVA